MMIHKLCCLAIVTTCCLSPASHGQCLVGGDGWESAEGGCKDLETGLVWGPDLRAFASNTTSCGSNAQAHIDSQMNGDTPYNGYSDWRLFTIAEAETAIAHGLNSHLDFFLDGSPDDGTYRWSADHRKVRGQIRHYGIRFSDGDVQLSHCDARFLLGVRGLPAPDGGGNNGNGKGGGRPKTSAVPEPTSALLGAFGLGMACLGARSRSLRASSAAMSE